MQGRKKLYYLGFLYCLFILGVAFFLEYYLEIEPCSLCLLQRVVIFAVGILFIFLVAFYKNKIFHFFIICLIFILNIAGISLAGRQVWLQHLPPELTPSCTAGIERLLDSYPLLEVLKIVILGTGDCAKVEFEILGFSLASFSLFNFVILLIFNCYLIHNNQHSKKDE